MLGQSQPITADATDLALQWKSGSSAAWKGRQVRLRIEWQQGTLFSFTGLEDR